MFLWSDCVAVDDPLGWLQLSGHPCDPLLQASCPREYCFHNAIQKRDRVSAWVFTDLQIRVKTHRKDAQQ